MSWRGETFGCERTWENAWSGGGPFSNILQFSIASSVQPALFNDKNNGRRGLADALCGGLVSGRAKGAVDHRNETYRTRLLLRTGAVFPAMLSGLSA